MKMLNYRKADQYRLPRAANVFARHSSLKKDARMVKRAGAKLGVVVGDEIISLVGASGIPNSMTELIAAGPEALKRVERAAQIGARLPFDSVRLLASIPRPPEFLGVGLNYRDHALEAKMTLPSAPSLFNGQTSCITGPFDDIVMPRVSDQLDLRG